MKQTIKYRLNPNFEQEKHLHNLCSIATKLGSVALSVGGRGGA